MLEEIVEPLLSWYEKNKRELPWRTDPTPYHVWVSEIMLQQTRVEAVKGYYSRFLAQLPDIEDLAGCPQEKLLKLWEGLGYYNRVKNMQKAAIEIRDRYGGVIPKDYEKILALPGIGSYTAGAISSIAYQIPEPAVDGNVLRVFARLTEEPEDILKQKTKKKAEDILRKIIPLDVPGEFNQSLIELGALVCVPNGPAKCPVCPVRDFCLARAYDRVGEFPKKAPKKKRKVEERTVLILQNGQELKWLTILGLIPLHIADAGEAKHIFSHVEWRMKGYFIKVASTEEKKIGELIFVDKKETKGRYPIPSAFSAYRKYIEEDF